MLQVERGIQDEENQNAVIARKKNQCIKVNKKRKHIYQIR